MSQGEGFIWRLTSIVPTVDEGKAQVVEDREFDKLYNRSDGVSGLLIVLKNL